MKGTQKNGKGTVNLNKTERTVILEKILLELKNINHRVENLEKIYSSRTAELSKSPEPEISLPDFFVDFT